jgi:hypothetical protein
MLRNQMIICTNSSCPQIRNIKIFSELAVQDKQTSGWNWSTFRGGGASLIMQYFILEYTEVIMNDYSSADP